MSETEYCIAANVISDRLLRQGAKVYILGTTGGAFPQTRIYGLARWGRRIEKYINMARLKNFRAAWNPYKELIIWDYTKEQAERVARWYNFYFELIRAYSPDGGVLIKPGLPESQVLIGFDSKIEQWVATENYITRQNNIAGY